jgi:hypothetical protein
MNARVILFQKFESSDHPFVQGLESRKIDLVLDLVVAVQVLEELPASGNKCLLEISDAAFSFPEICRGLTDLCTCTPQRLVDLQPVGSQPTEIVVPLPIRLRIGLTQVSHRTQQAAAQIKGMTWDGLSHGWNRLVARTPQQSCGHLRVHELGTKSAKSTGLLRSWDGECVAAMRPLSYCLFGRHVTTLAGVFC